MVFGLLHYPTPATTSAQCSAKACFHWDEPRGEGRESFTALTRSLQPSSGLQPVVINAGHFGAACDVGLVGSVETQQVGFRAKTGKDVVSISKVVFRVVVVGQMPERTVAQRQNRFDNWGRTFDGVVFHEQHRAELVDCFLATVQHPNFPAFDVDFDEPTGFQVQVINSNDIDSFSFPMTVCVHGGEVELLAWINDGDCGLSPLVCDGNLQGGDVSKFVERDVGTQVLEAKSLRLQCDDAACITDLASKRDGVRTDVGSHIDDDSPRTDELMQNVKFAFTPFSVQIQCPAHHQVLPVEQKHPVAACLDVHVVVGQFRFE